MWGEVLETEMNGRTKMNQPRVTASNAMPGRTLSSFWKRWISSLILQYQKNQ
jgi:hypothetical protein